MLLVNGNLDVRKLLGGDVAGVPITHVAVGTDGSAVTGNETSLTGQVTTPVLSVDYSTPGIVRFVCQLAASDPAMTVLEFGLVDANGVLCYRTLSAPKIKAAGVTYNINYNIVVQ